MNSRLPLERCRAKTERGNLYRTLCMARRDAQNIQEHTGHPVRAFRCKVCGWWHIGKSTGVEARKLRTEQRAREEPH